MNSLKIFSFAVADAKKESKKNPGVKILVLFDKVHNEFTIVPEYNLQKHESIFGKLPIMATVFNGEKI